MITQTKTILNLSHSIYIRIRNSKFLFSDCFRQDTSYNGYFISPGAGCVCWYNTIIFRRKTFFERKILNSVVGVFLFLKLPMTSGVELCRVGVLYKTSVGYHRGSEAGGGFESRKRPYFFTSF